MTEALGEALFALSDRLRADGFLDRKDHHAVYERVVAAFNAPADAGEVRKDAHWALGRALDLIDSLYREYGVTLDSTDTLVAQQARNIWLSLLASPPVTDRYREGIEDAAKVAEMWDHRGDIAAAIRALPADDRVE